ncbi:putative transmembrane protein [Toxoplasma gondii RUB]|uniref:Putative transmembrane protein n=1 Tax=Toxoplasma gondii RUB TaxID=935652 RepID=A0A086M2N3_TOXGO|nr:putative transmembrane protein [Toxoplasma gondii RUB]
MNRAVRFPKALEFSYFGGCLNTGPQLPKPTRTVQASDERTLQVIFCSKAEGHRSTIFVLLAVIACSILLYSHEAAKFSVLSSKIRLSRVDPLTSRRYGHLPTVLTSDFHLEFQVSALGLDASCSPASLRFLESSMSGPTAIQRSAGKLHLAFRRKDFQQSCW